MTQEAGDLRSCSYYVSCGAGISNWVYHVPHTHLKSWSFLNLCMHLPRSFTVALKSLLQQMLRVEVLISKGGWGNTNENSSLLVISSKKDKHCIVFFLHVLDKVSLTQHCPAAYGFIAELWNWPNLKKAKKSKLIGSK